MNASSWFLVSIHSPVHCLNAGEDDIEAGTEAFQVSLHIVVAHPGTAVSQLGCRAPRNLVPLLMHSVICKRTGELRPSRVRDSPDYTSSTRLVKPAGA